MDDTRDSVKQDDPAEGSVENVNVSTAPAGVDNANVAEELVALEKRYWQAIRDNDLEAALDLTDDPCIVTGAQGVASLDRGRFRDLMRSANFKIEDVYFDSDVHVRRLGSDTAVLAYTVHERLTVDGKSVTVDAADASTWVRRGGRWRCALHTESIKGDPFGRDRATA
jgi:uncharacterized protein (TIGR02246 family)